MTFYAYIYRDPSRNNEPIYVGKGKGRRAWKHLSRVDMHPFVQRIQLMRRTGIDPHIEIIDALDEKHAFFLEQCYIVMFGRKDLGLGTLLNLTYGGEGTTGMKHSPESRTRMSEDRKGKPLTDAYMKAASERKGKPLSIETRNKMSEARKGRKFSPETRAKISASNKGKIMSVEARAKMSASQKKRTIPLDVRMKISATMKAIRSAET